MIEKPAENPVPFFPATAVILAGGQSRRMAQDKRFLPYQNKPLIQQVVETLRPHFAQLLLVAPDPELLSFLGVPIIGDLQADSGPLAGIASALAALETELCFVCACDIPRPPLGLIQLLFEAVEEYDCAAPRRADGTIECLFTFFRKSLACDASATLASGSRRVHEFIARTNTVYVPMEGYLLKNVNSPADYQRLISCGENR